ncbi:MinD/ParA family protein [uncultured Jatrophihabitans sp.]|uniref:MinD/ParA family ATP-binding protein n=1 Tax=uncultured Jatrophihabitans sp. TaxID=1610747 RepID=UPI0035C9745E
MTHSTDDRDGAAGRIPEGVPLDRQAPGQPPSAARHTDWATDATAVEPSGDESSADESANAWSAAPVHYSSSDAAPGDAQPSYEPAPAEPAGYGAHSWEQRSQAPGFDAAPPPPARPTPGPQPEPQSVPWDQHQASRWPAPDQQSAPSVQQPQPQGPQQQQQGPQQQQQQPQPQWDQQYQQPAANPAQGPQHYAPAYAPQQPVPPQPALPPKPEDLLVPNQSSVVAQPASWGWRGRVNRATGGLVKSKAAPAELQARQAINDIQRSFSHPMTVVVVQPKGGAGKTPTTICLSAAFGSNRGGYVVGWDDNETRGTLAVRVTNPDSKQKTVWDLLGDLAAFERFDARVGDLSDYVRSQPDAHFDALVSDDNPGNMSQIGEGEYERLHKVLQRFYRMIVVDTGNNVRSSNWQAAVDSADLVVVVSSYQRDVGYSGSWVLDHLAQTGREELARNAVTVLTAADPTTDKTVRGQLLEHFTARTRAVIEIPYDPELAHGGPIQWTSLAAPTRNAWIQAGATIANCLAEQDQRALSERRA